MVSNGNGVTTRGAAQKEKEKEKNKKRLQDALVADLPPGKAQMANEQASIAPAPDDKTAGVTGPSVQAQSKPPYNVAEGITSNTETQDIDMDRSVDTGSEKDMSSTPEPGSDTDSSISSASSVSVDNLRVTLESLSIGNTQSGVVDGYGGPDRCRFFILKEGPSHAPFYRFERTNAYSTEGFRCLSDKEESIPHLYYRDNNGRKCYHYTVNNIEAASGIAIEERDESLGYVKGPQTWIRIDWKGIKPEHRELLMKLPEDDEVENRTSSWVTKTDLVGMLKEKLAMTFILKIWDEQEKRRLKSKYGAKMTANHVPAPCPLEIFAAKKEKQGSSRSRSAVPKRPRAQTPKFRLGGSPESFESLMEQPERSGTPGVVVKEEPFDNSLFVSQDSPNHRSLLSDMTERQPRNPDEGRADSSVGSMLSNSNDHQGEELKKTRAPLRFSFKSFMEGVSKREKWGTLSEDDKLVKMAKAEARWDRYKQERELAGDICEDDEEIRVD